jgi:hypothetical protein
MPPRGIYEAMNLALTFTSPNGLVWFLNPGDVVINGRAIREIVNSVFKLPTSWGLVQAVYSSSNSDPFPTKYPDVRSILSGKNGFSHQAMFVPRILFDSIGLFNLDYRISSDLEFQCRLLSRNSCIFIEEVGVEIDTTGVSHKRLLRTYWETHLIRIRSGVFSGFSGYRITSRLLFGRLLKIRKGSRG